MKRSKESFKGSLRARQKNKISSSAIDILDQDDCLMESYPKSLSSSSSLVMKSNTVNYSHPQISNRVTKKKSSSMNRHGSIKSFNTLNSNNGKNDLFIATSAPPTPTIPQNISRIANPFDETPYAFCFTHEDITKQKQFLNNLIGNSSLPDPPAEVVLKGLCRTVHNHESTMKFSEYLQLTYQTMFPTERANFIVTSLFDYFNLYQMNRFYKSQIDFILDQLDRVNTDAINTKFELDSALEDVAVQSRKQSLTASPKKHTSATVCTDDQSFTLGTSSHSMLPEDALRTFGNENFFINSSMTESSKTGFNDDGQTQQTEIEYISLIEKFKAEVSEKHEREISSLEKVMQEKEKGYEEEIKELKKLLEHKDMMISTFSSIKPEVNPESTKSKEIESSSITDKVNEEQQKIQKNEVDKLEARIKILGEQRDKLSTENSKVSDECNLLQIRSERLRTDIFCLTSQQEDITKELELSQKILEEKRNESKLMEERYNKSKIDLAEIEMKKENVLRSSEKIVRLAELEKQLSEGKLIAMVCLLYDLLVDVMNAMNEYITGNMASQAYLNGFNLVTEASDPVTFSRLHTERMESCGIKEIIQKYENGNTIEVAKPILCQNLEKERLSDITLKALSCGTVEKRSTQNLPISSASLNTDVCDSAGSCMNLSTADTIVDNPVDELQEEINVTDLVILENIELYKHCKERCQTDGPSTSNLIKLHNGEHPIYRDYKTMTEVEADFFKYIENLSTVFDNVKFILNYTRLMDSSRDLEVERLKTKQLNSLRDAENRYETKLKAIEAKAQYLRRNCEYFKSENDRIIRFHNKEDTSNGKQEKTELDTASTLEDDNIVISFKNKMKMNVMFTDSAVDNDDIDSDSDEEFREHRERMKALRMHKFASSI